jgi:hypothetical protein
MPMGFMHLSVHAIAQWDVSPGPLHFDAHEFMQRPVLPYVGMLALYGWKAEWDGRHGSATEPARSPGAGHSRFQHDGLHDVLSSNP